MRRTTYEREEAEGRALFYFVAGAIGGGAAGAYLARRYRTRAEVVDALRSGLARLREYWDATADVLGEEESDVLDADESDDLLDEEDDTASLHAGADAMPALVSDDDAPELTDSSESVPPAPAPVDRREERALERAVLSAFEHDPVLRERSVSIAAVGRGVVELTGSVHAVDEAARAASVARHTPGVTMVLNRVTVRGSGSVDTTSVPRDGEDTEGSPPPAAP
jgi:BON domain